jgi:long-chain acyl-CoA synthetase
MPGSDAPLASAFERRARDFPEVPVVVSGHCRVPAREIFELARRWAALLTAAGTGPGRLVAVSSPNGPAFLAALLAVRRLGAAALLLDPQTPETARSGILRHLGAGVSLECPSGWPDGSADTEPRIGAVAASSPAEVSPRIAVVKLTSGTTGRPRGILTTGEALLADDAQLARTMGLTEREHILATLPWSHSYALSSVVLPALVRPSTLVLPAGGHPLEPLRALALVRSQEVTFLPSVPVTLRAWARRVREASEEGRAALASVRRVISAGAPLTPAVAEAFRDAFGRPVHTFYGASECGGICYDRTGEATLRGSVGTPVDGVTVHLEPGGTVTVESPAVACRYLGDGPDGRLGDGRFRTQDQGCWVEGELVLGARVDGLINVRGKKVDPREVEEVLGRLGGVEEVVALGVTGPGGETVLRAVVACQPGRLAYREVHRWCRSHLPGHKVPRSILLVNDLPRTSRGKIDRAALRTMTSDPAPAG